eukprot:2051374-Amphidinium_carterae.1
MSGYRHGGPLMKFVGSSIGSMQRIFCKRASWSGGASLANSVAVTGRTPFATCGRNHSPGRAAWIAPLC